MCDQEVESCDVLTKRLSDDVGLTDARVHGGGADTAGCWYSFRANSKLELASSQILPKVIVMHLIYGIFSRTHWVNSY